MSIVESGHEGLGAGLTVLRLTMTAARANIAAAVVTRTQRNVEKYMVSPNRLGGKVRRVWRPDGPGSELSSSRPPSSDSYMCDLFDPWS